MTAKPASMSRPRSGETLIFVHGLFGSELIAADGEVIWPPPAWEMLRGKYRKHQRLAEDTLTVNGILRTIGGCYPVYQPLIDFLEQLGYREARRTEQRSLSLFTYDWRRDLRLAADQLAEHIDGLPAGRKLTLLAHSLGGLVCRFLLESKRYLSRAWFGNITKLITLATPHDGAPAALFRAAGRQGVFGIPPRAFKALADDPRYPSGYQTLPPPGHRWVRQAGKDGSQAIHLDPFAADFVERHTLSAVNMKANAELHTALDLRRGQTRERSYYFIAGHGQETITRIDERKASLIASHDHGGDDLVPAHSAVSGSVPSEHHRETHGKIFRSRRVLRRLSVLLRGERNAYLRSLTASASASVVEAVIVPQRLVSPGETIAVSVEFSGLTDEFHDCLLAGPAPAPKDVAQPARRPTFKTDIAYRGPAIDALHCRFTCPRIGGIYDLRMASQGADEAALAQLAVQLSRTHRPSRGTFVQQG